MIISAVRDIESLDGWTRRWMLVAKAAAAKSQYERIHIGCAIVKGNWLVATGWNQRKSHPLQAKYNEVHRDFCTTHYLHSEIHALVASGRADLSGATGFTYRQDAAGRLLMCRPCPSCAAALSDAGLAHCYYTST